VVRIVAATGRGALEAFAVLCREYAASLPQIAASLTQQGFKSEMKTLPGLYAPPRGVVLLALPGDASERPGSGPSSAGRSGSGEIDVAVGLAIGCAAVRPCPIPASRGGGLERDIAELKRMYVRPSARGRGAGRMLAAAAVDFARGAGYASIRLDTDADMHGAMRIYEGLGFRPCPRYNDDPDPKTRWFEMPLRGAGV
jgi:GNAT superfamily N-acetyltransferase